VAFGPAATFAPGFAAGQNVGNNYGVLTIGTANGNVTTTSPTTVTAPANAGGTPVVIIPNLTSAGLGFGLGISPTNVVGSVLSLNLGAPASTGGQNSGSSNGSILGNLASGFLVTSSGGGTFNLDPITSVQVNAVPTNYATGQTYSYLIGTVPAASTGGVTNLGNFSFANGGVPFTNMPTAASVMVTGGSVYLNFSLVPVPEPTAVCGMCAAGFGLAALVRRRLRKAAA
jgi:hypothetical protein